LIGQKIAGGQTKFPCLAAPTRNRGEGEGGKKKNVRTGPSKMQSGEYAYARLDDLKAGSSHDAWARVASHHRKLPAEQPYKKAGVSEKNKRVGKKKKRNLCGVTRSGASNKEDHIESKENPHDRF